MKDYTGVVMCCRQNEYKKLSINAGFRHTYVIQPLSSSQVNEYLQQMGIDLKYIQKIIEIDRVFPQLFLTPFMLNILIKSYGSLDFKEINLKHTIFELQSVFFNAYINEIFQNRSAKYDKEHMLLYLSILAFIMRQTNQTIFSIPRNSYEEYTGPDYTLHGNAGLLNFLFKEHPAKTFIALGVVASAPLLVATGGIIGGVKLVKKQFKRSNPVDKILRVTDRELTQTLDASVDLGLLRKVGDEWMFPHQSLLEYFASKIEVDEEGAPVVKRND